MSENKKMVIIRSILVIIIILLLTLLFIPNSKPMEIIESKLNTKLPSSSKISQFNYNRVLGDLNAKILIDAQSLDSIKKGLLKHFNNEYIIRNYADLPHNQNVISWWDLEEGDIEVCYKKIEGVKKHLIIPTPKTSIFWAIISKQKDGKYYLYLSHY
ncbi:hypothetical protein [Lachnoclostridium phytofermentans]|uniref:hypothetical protein n=1 Tax=Lachnoclostridium phytofermentans TaxID=66219 RepID=UPI0004956D58|nr:hypothetical protein [Lachnoclostridium phytofermentans]